MGQVGGDVSGICGWIHLAGGPLEVGEFAAMQRVMRKWGPDSARDWSDESAALGQYLFWDTPESRYDHLPSAVGNGVLTAEARIDNRKELLETLDIAASRHNTISDGELVRLAYEQWGLACAARLFGDWSFAAWQPAQRRLALARDHHGNTSLYYTRIGPVLAFASDRRALLALRHGGRRLNELYLAQLLVSWPAYQGADTAFQDIQRVPPAHTLTASPDGSALTRYWRLEDVPECQLASAEAYAEGLRHHLTVAVRARVRTQRPVAVTLSGGLDSGAVAVLAARELGATGRELKALTAVPLVGPTREMAAGNEYAMAALTAASATNIAHEAVAGRLSPLDGLERLLQIHAEPGHAAASYYWILALMDSSRGHVLLTGQNGNASLSWAGVPAWSDIFDALARRDPAGAARAAGTWAAWQPVAIPLRRFWRSGFRPTLGQPWRRYSAINPDFADRLELEARMADDGHDPSFAARPRDGRSAQLTALRPGRHIVGALWAELGADGGAVVRDPTQDVRLLEFAVGIPNRMWRGPQDRWLVRQALTTILPEEARLAPRRAAQTSDLGARMKLERDRTLGLIAEIERSAPAREAIDVEYLRRVATDLQSAGWQDWVGRGASVVARGVCIGLFVARSEASYRVPGL